MLSRELLYIIRAKDEAGKVFQGVREAINGVNGSAGQAGKTMGLLSGVLTQQAGQNIKDFGQRMTSALGGFLEAGRESVQTTRALDAVLRSTKGAAGLTAQEVSGLADSLARVTNFEDETVLRGENLLLTFTKVGRDVFPMATEAMLNMSTAMRTDVQSSAIQLGKALNDPVNGIDALTRVGVSFNEQQKEMIKNMAESGNVAGAQKLILKELETEFGGLARGTADAGMQLTKSFGEIKEEIGKTLLPAFNQAVEALLPVLQGVQKWIADNPELVKTIGMVVAAIGGLATVLGTLVVTLGTVAASLAVLGIALGPASVIFLAIMGISALVIVLRDNWVWMAQAMRDNVGAAVEWLIAKFNELMGVIQSAIDRINVFQQVQSAIQLAQFQVKDYSVPGRATGGTVNEPFTLVGERGPEVVSLPRGSYVHTAAETKGMMGGNSVTVGTLIGSVHVYNEADEDRLVAKMQQTLTRLIQLQSLRTA